MTAAELIEKITEYCKGKDPSTVPVVVEVYDNEYVEFDYEDVGDINMVTNADDVRTIVIKY